jgi:FkbM family methyltransferase
MGTTSGEGRPSSSLHVRIPRRGGGLDELELQRVKRSVVARSLRTGGLRGWQAPTTAALFASWELAKEGAFFDIGANIGLYALLHARFRPDAQTVAFEPTPDLLEAARFLAALNGVVVHLEGVAVSEATGEATLHLSSRSDSSNSLLAGFRESSRSLVVPTETLDHYVERTGVRPAVVKIDVEGHEPSVLRGANHVLAMYAPIIVIELLEGRPSADESRALLADAGYEGRLLTPPRGVVATEPPEQYRDWVYWPERIPRRFDRTFRRWAKVVDRCGPVD